MIKTILFDFDGVIVDSMAVRDEGFKEIARAATNNESIVEEFIAYHRYNGGLSRFVKIKYLYENMLGKEISEEQILAFATDFSNLMKSKLTDKKIIMQETVNFISNNYNNYNFHIVSGSEHKELNYLCKELNLAEFFLSIKGSPTHKNILVEDIMENYNYEKYETILIGDSITDYEAARNSDIKFYGYNNEDLRILDDYINTFENFTV